MRPRSWISLVFVLIAPLAHGDSVTDLRATLRQLTATTAVRGTLEVTSTTTSSESDQPDSGKATVELDVNDAGLRILYPRGALMQAAQEARGEAIDPERATPARSGLEHIRPLHVAALLDGGGAMSVLLENAQLVEAKMAPFRGKSSRLLVIKITPKLSKSTAKHIKKIDNSLSVWLGDDGVPVAAEMTTNVKASFLLMSFESDHKEIWSYLRVGDRLVVTHYDSTQKSDGFGQHTTSRTTESITLQTPDLPPGR